MSVLRLAKILNFHGFYRALHVIEIQQGVAKLGVHIGVGAFHIDILSGETALPMPLKTHYLPMTFVLK